MTRPAHNLGGTSVKDVPLKIAVVGAGAIGGLIAGRLSLAGQTVSLIARGATLHALQRDGLTLVDGATNTTQRTRPAVCANPEAAGQQDFVVLTVKAYSLREVARDIAPMIGPHTRIVTAINGVPWWFATGLDVAPHALDALDPDEALRSALPTGRIIGCVINCAASSPAPAIIQHASGNRLTLGRPQRGHDPATAVLVEALCAAGFDAVHSEFIHQDYWKKLLGNITLNPTGALTLADTRSILDDAAVSEAVLGVMREVLALGNAIGIDIGISAEQRLGMASRLGNFRSSMLQDLEAGKPLELDGLFAAVIELGRQTNTLMPGTQFLYALARLRAQSTHQFLPTAPHPN